MHPAALLALILLILAGCGETPRCWNPNGIPRVTVSDPERVHNDGLARGAHCRAGCFIAAWNDKDTREIRLPDNIPRNRLVALALHEFGHEIEANYPDVWRHLNAMATPNFPCGEDDTP